MIDNREPAAECFFLGLPTWTTWSKAFDWGELPKASDLSLFPYHFPHCYGHKNGALYRTSFLVLTNISIWLWTIELYVDGKISPQWSFFRGLKGRSNYEMYEHGLCSNWGIWCPAKGKHVKIADQRLAAMQNTAVFQECPGNQAVSVLLNFVKSVIYEIYPDTQWTSCQVWLKLTKLDGDHPKHPLLKHQFSLKTMDKTCPSLGLDPIFGPDQPITCSSQADQQSGCSTD